MPRGLSKVGVITILSMVFARAFAAPEVFLADEYDKLAIEVVTEIRTFMQQSYECEETFGQTGNQRNQHCNEALRTGQIIIALSKIVSLDQDHPLAGINADLRQAYMISGIRLLDTMQEGNPDLRVRKVQPEESTSKVQPSSSSLGLKHLTVSFRLNELSWVSLKDENDKDLFDGLVNAGDPMEFTNKPPLTLVIGRANAIDNLMVNGQNYSFKDSVQMNVLRLTLR